MSSKRTASAKKKLDVPKQQKKTTANLNEANLGVLLSISQAAEEFGHDRKTIAKRISELEIRPVAERAGYPVYRLRELLGMERKGADGQHDPDQMSPFERQAHYKAESERLKVDAERGSLMRREEVEFEWARVLKGITLEMETLVDEIERDIGASPLVLEAIEGKIDLVRQRIYESIVGGAAALERVVLQEEEGATGAVCEPA